MRAIKRVPLGFSTVGKPDLSFQETQSLALNFGMDFIELRALGGTVRLPEYFSTRPLEVEATHNRVPVRVLGSSLRLVNTLPEDLDEFESYAKLAAAFSSPYIRVFGGKKWGIVLSEDDMRNAATTVSLCREILKKHSPSCEIILETHSAFSTSESCLSLNRFLDEPIAILWDSHHTWRLANETPTETWSKIGPLVRHIHHKDSASDTNSPDGFKYVLPGKGEYPYADLFQLVERESYSGGLSLEWEKLWHPELADIQDALKAFADVLNTPVITDAPL